MKILMLLLISLQCQPAKAQVSFEPVSDHVYHVRIDNNQSSVKAALIRYEQEVILVDAMYGKFAKAIADHLASEGLQLKYVINTHYHGDHIQGNTEFRDTDILAHRMTYENIADSAQYGPGAGFEMADMPDVLFEKEMRVTLGDISVQLVHFGNAHTTGDIIVFIPEDNVVCIGDMILDKGALPFTTDPESLMKVLNATMNRMNEETLVITGHGRIIAKSDIRDLTEIVHTTISHIRSGKEDYPETWNQWDSPFLTMKAWLALLKQIYK